MTIDIETMNDNLPESVAEAGAKAEVDAIQFRKATKEKSGEAPTEQPVAQAVSSGSPTHPEPTHPTHAPVAPAPAAPTTVAPGAVAPPPQPAPAVAPVASPQASNGVPLTPGAVVRTPDEVERENRDLKFQLSQFHGTYGGKLGQLREENERLTTELQTAQTASATAVVAPAVTPEIKAMTEDLTTRYGEGFVDAVNVLADEKIKALRADPSSSAAVAAAQEATRDIKELRESIQSEKFWAQAEVLAPGSSVINGDPTVGLPCSPGWGEFLDQPINVGSATTRRQDAVTAIDTQNAMAFATLVNTFKQTQHTPDSPDPTRPTAEAQAMPASVVGATPPPADPRKRMIPQSEITAFQAKCGQPDGAVTFEESEIKTAEYRLAYQEKRVVLGQ